MIKDEYKRGFNYGYNLAVLDKDLFDKIVKDNPSNNDFYLGILEGEQQLQKEKDIPEKTKSIQEKLIEKYSKLNLKSLNVKGKQEIKSKEISKEK